MRYRSRLFKTLAVTLLMCYLQGIVPSGYIMAQSPPCAYNKKNPSVENARNNFRVLNYICAEQELLDYLKNDKLTLEEKSNAHILLAAVYYAMLKDESEKKERVLNQFREAFKAYREWRGELDIKSPEFVDLMDKAKMDIDQEIAAQEAREKAKEDSARMATPTETKKGKPWYTKWWAIGLGVGLAAGVAVAVAGGGGEEPGPTPVDTLPSFPPPPGK
jgi:hypothetical protein